MSTIALAQTGSGNDVAENLANAARLVAVAADRQADVIAFPEVFLYVGDPKRKREIAEPVDGPSVSRFRELAARGHLMILLGSIHERIDDERRICNTSVLIGPDGAVLAVYRKLKLFDIELPQLRIKESDTVAPGHEPPPVIDTPIGRVGLTICFDLRFADLYHGLRARGAEIVFVPSNFTAPTGAAHWEILLRSRAVENQVYMAAPAQWGPHDASHTSHGHSMLVDPWGTIVAQAPEGVGLTFGTIDLDYLRRVRRELPMGFPT